MTRIKRIELACHIHFTSCKAKMLMKIFLYLAMFISFQSLISCGNGGSSGGSSSETVTSGVEACPQTAIDQVNTGCNLNIDLPKDCATVSLNSEFSWIGDACHTPYYLQVTGSPPSEDVYNEIQVNTIPINANAWAEPFGLNFIDGLTTDNGWYHWRICNAYGNGCSKSQAFKYK